MLLFHKNGLIFSTVTIFVYRYHDSLYYSFIVMQAEIGDMANTFFSIGMIFWGCFGIIGSMTVTCWYKFCRPGAKGDVCDICDP